MSDLEMLVVFVVIVGLVVAFGVLVGMIVAGRIDRIMAPRPVPGVEERTEQEDLP
jgi:hypothetical protein